jgi:peroxiredoxin
MKKLLFLLPVMAILIGLTSAQWNSPAPGYAVGDIAADFSLKNVDGKMVSMADYKEAKGYILVFTCNGCPYAKKYEQRIIDLHNKYEKRGFPVIAINPNDPEVVPEDSYKKMQELAKQKKYPFAYLFDEGQQVYPRFGATRTPHVFILDNTRKVRYIGGIDENPDDAAAAVNHYADDAVGALLKGTDPNPSLTKALGCGIKRKQ